MEVRAIENGRGHNSHCWSTIRMTRKQVREAVIREAGDIWASIHYGPGFVEFRFDSVKAEHAGRVANLSRYLYENGIVTGKQ